EDNKIKINSKIDVNNISKFDGQGSIRKMFEDKSFDSDEFLNKFFPSDPLVNKYIDIYNDEISRYINDLKNKEQANLSKQKIAGFKVQLIESRANTLNLKNIPQIEFTSINRKKTKIGKIIEHIQSINKKYAEILKNEYLETDDKKVINEILKSNDSIATKYQRINVDLDFEVKKRNIINDVFDLKNKEYRKSQTDETEKITSYDNSKTSFINNLIDYYVKSHEELFFSPNITEEDVPYEYNKIGNYRFVKKTTEKKISNSRFISIIKECLGKSFKDINSVDSNKIPEKFSDRGKDTTYDDKLSNLEKSLKDCISELFEVKKAINDASDTDITKELSAGFNSRIYFDLISNQNDDNRIYIIDQPEDDVSQPAIKKNLLSDFNDMSKNKQIIMITHNPQFIVNLDVDNVIFLGKDDNGNIYIQSGALEYADDIYDVLDIVANNIEGGIESINERWKRYEKNIYNV
nr:ATP-binding protein [Bacilli bacterium]